MKEEAKKQSSFEILSSVNVEQFVKGKNGFKYLTWAHAVSELLKRFPEAQWSHKTWNDIPFLKTDAGCFVEVTVTLPNGVSRTQLHPVLNYANKPIMSPNAFEVNSSLQRALAKAIGLHGLGLYVYAGEDLPLSEQEAIQEARAELTALLKIHNKYDQNAGAAIGRMSYDDLTSKIQEYRKKEA